MNKIKENFRECIICGRMYEVYGKKYHCKGGTKVGRNRRNKDSITCSKKCAQRYIRIYNRIKWNILKKQSQTQSIKKVEE